MQGFLDPDKILDELEIHDDIVLKRDMIVADFGCGSGGFTIPLAKRLDNGLVHAVDIQESSLSALKSQTLLDNLSNIRFIRADLEESKASSLQDSSIDLVLVVNTLFQIDDKNAIISEADRILKKQGRLLIIDWLPQAPQGPETRISPDDVKKRAQDIGFALKKEIKARKYHYGLVFEKS